MEGQQGGRGVFKHLNSWRLCPQRDRLSRFLGHLRHKRNGLLLGKDYSDSTAPRWLQDLDVVLPKRFPAIQAPKQKQLSQYQDPDAQVFCGLQGPGSRH